MAGGYLLRILSIVCILAIKKIRYCANNQRLYVVIGTSCFEKSTPFHLDSQGIVVMATQKFEEFRVSGTMPGDGENLSSRWLRFTVPCLAGKRPEPCHREQTGESPAYPVTATSRCRFEYHHGLLPAYFLIKEARGSLYKAA